MDDDLDFFDDLISATERLSDQLDADIILFDAPMADRYSMWLVRECGTRDRRRTWR